MTPKGPTAAPSFVRNAGMIVWNGRLPGSSTFGWPRSRVNAAPRFWRTIPVPGTTTCDPHPSNADWMKLTIIPSESAAQR
jgi:hypothetical protein